MKASKHHDSLKRVIPTPLLVVLAVVLVTTPYGIYKATYVQTPLRLITEDTNHNGPRAIQAGGVDIIAQIQELALTDATQVSRSPAQSYWVTPTARNTTFLDYRQKVAAYLKSAAFQQRWEIVKQQTDNKRGIVIATGGRYYLPQTVAALRVLRTHLKVMLPIELYWHGDGEMPKEGLQVLKQEFDPLEGYDVTKLPYPEHQLPGARIRGFPMKPYALLHSRFQQVLLLDCDVILARDPTFMFTSQGFAKHGNWFWGDVWGQGLIKDAVFNHVGLDIKAKAALWEGKYDFKRYAESGQIMIDKAKHLDVLEWAWFLNSFSDDKNGVYSMMYGDKDTYMLAFALAGKAHHYQQMNMPPGGIFTHRDSLGWLKPPQQQLNKAGNWWLHALAHYAEDNQVLLYHRVNGELFYGKGTPVDEVITPPMPHTWTLWHLAMAPGKELHNALAIMNYNLTHLLHTTPPFEVCPLRAWAAYWAMRTHGIPTPRRPGLERDCQGVLTGQYGPQAAELVRTSGLLEDPIRLVVNRRWDDQDDGRSKPEEPLLAVPLNMTDAYRTWQQLNESAAWMNKWLPANIPAPASWKGG